MMERFLRIAEKSIRTIAVGLLAVIQPIRRFLPLTLISYWWSTRNWTQFFYGVPSLLAGFVLIGCGFFAVRQDRKDPSVRQLMANGVAARNNGEEKIAAMYFEKAKRAETRSPAERYSQAMLLLQQKQSTEAMKILFSLTPLREPGYVPAREWVIGAIGIQWGRLSQIKEPSEEEQRTLAKLTDQLTAHCEQMLRDDPDNAVAMERLADLRLKQQNYREAIEWMRRLSLRFGAFHYELAKLLYELKRHDESIEEARLAEVFHRDQLKTPTLSASQKAGEKIKLSVCLMLQKRFREAAEVLIENGASPTDPALGEMLSEVLFQWSQSFQVIDPLTGTIKVSELKSKLNVLEKALQLKSSDGRVQASLGAIAGVDEATSVRANQILRGLIESGEAKSIVYFALGISESTKGNFREARSLFESADQRSPSTPVILNNMAYALAHGEDADPERALQIINRAIQISGGHAELYDTRGTIHLLMRRWKAAIADFDKALSGGVRDLVHVHRSLAKAYREIGDETMAELHQQQSSTLAARRDRQ